VALAHFSGRWPGRYLPGKTASGHSRVPNCGITIWTRVFRERAGITLVARLVYAGVESTLWTCRELLHESRPEAFGMDSLSVNNFCCRSWLLPSRRFQRSRWSRKDGGDASCHRESLTSTESLRLNELNESQAHDPIETISLRKNHTFLIAHFGQFAQVVWPAGFL
jgi:hypothetical protein